MSEKDMREILAGEYRRDWGGHAQEMAREDKRALRAMQEVERRTIERCAKVAEEWPNTYHAKTEQKRFSLFDVQRFVRAACRMVGEDLRALQDAPSDDTPPARKAELWSDGNG
jgi:hypothetical protein